MRVVVLMLSLLVLAGTGRRAEAQDYPWCASYSKGCTSCSFVSSAQCMADVSGLGGFCQPNNASKPAGAAPLRHRLQTRS
jgi:hypothetical protein